MNNQCKVLINLQEGVIELEGSETFVSKYLDEFKGKIFDQSIKNQGSRVGESVVTKPVISIKPKSKKLAKSPSKVKAKKVEPEEFDIKKADDEKTPSLGEFFESKNPSETVAHRIAVIGYYITKIKKQPNFSEGNIDFAYITLPLNKRPVYLRQACIDAKNRNHYLEEDDNEPGKWKLSRIGEIFVEDKLPSKSMKNAD